MLWLAPDIGHLEDAPTLGCPRTAPKPLEGGLRSSVQHEYLTQILCGTCATPLAAQTHRQHPSARAPTGLELFLAGIAHCTTLLVVLLDVHYGNLRATCCL